MTFSMWLETITSLHVVQVRQLCYVGATWINFSTKVVWNELKVLYHFDSFTKLRSKEGTWSAKVWKYESMRGYLQLLHFRMCKFDMTGMINNVITLWLSSKNDKLHATVAIHTQCMWKSKHGVKVAKKFVEVDKKLSMLQKTQFAKQPTTSNRAKKYLSKWSTCQCWQNFDNLEDNNVHAIKLDHYHCW